MSNAVNPAPGFKRKPGHVVDIKPAGVSYRAMIGQTVVADSDKALLVEESNHDPVYYVPMADCDLTLFRPTERKTYCPYKGEASYWTLRRDDAELSNIAWSYDTPFDEAMPLKGHLAFYPSMLLKVTVG